MVEVRVQGKEAVVRYAGRRLRVTKEWSRVPEDSLEKLRAAVGDRLKVRDGAPGSEEEDGESASVSEESTETTTDAPPEPEKKGRGRSKGNRKAAGSKPSEQ